MLAVRPRAVLFDLDDTLVRTGAYWTRQVIRTVAGRSLRSPLEGWRAVRALQSFRRARESTRSEGPFPDLRAEVLARASALSGLHPDQIRSAVYPLIYETDFPGLERWAIPGVAAMITRVRGAGIRVGVLSDYPVEEKLRAARLLDLSWDLIMTAEEVGTLKPHPRVFERALDRLGLAPTEVLYVGDRPDTDVEGAKASGLLACQVRRRGSRLSREADLVVRDVTELVKLLEL